ncbi:hypothetical protein EC991_000420 [Linnemannia zychae]|nr:hypothetical protein EC991_000420 [Linnemannia zychae]
MDENNNDNYEHEEDDLDSLDLNILTPRENVHVTDPFDHHHPTTTTCASLSSAATAITPSRQDQTGEEEGDRAEQGDVSRQSLQGYHRNHSSRSSMASYKQGHVKSASQLSSGVVTVEGTTTPTTATRHHPTANSFSTASPPQSPSALSISSHRYSSSSSASRQYRQQQQQQQSAEDMMYASPDYRKSLTMSIQSDVPPGTDFSGRHSARGSSMFVSDQQQQYSNLLRDATWMIEQQHLQNNNDDNNNSSSGSSHNRVDHSSEEGETNTSSSRDNGANDGFGGHISLSTSSTMSPGAATGTVHTTTTTTTASSHHPSEEGSVNTRTPSSSKKGTMTRSRSRRFSAPGSQYSGHGSVSSISRASAMSSSTHEPPGPQASVDQETRFSSSSSAGLPGARAPQAATVQQPRDPSLSSQRHFDSSSDEDDFGDHYSRGEGNNQQRSKHTIQPLQHHPTIQPYLSSNNHSTVGLGIGLQGAGGGPSSINSSSTLAKSLSPNHHYQNQPQLQRDYRPGVVFEYYEGEWDWLPNFDEMRPDHVGIVGNFMIDETTERDLFRPQVYTGATASGPGGNEGGGARGVDGPATGAGYQPKRRRPYKESGNFAVRFTTHMDITQDGVYSFWLSSNDGSVLYISNTLVVENDGMHYATEAEGRILLQAGRHPMTVEFFHRNGKMLEGFRSTGPSLVVSFRAPGPVWSFGLKAGPKRVVKSSNLFFDHGDIRLRNLLNEYGTDDDSSMSMMDRTSGCLSPTESRRSYNGGFGFGGQDWHQQQQQQYQNPQQHQGRHRVMSGDMGGGGGGGGGGQQMQLSTREMMVQIENARTTIKDLEQIIRDQAEDHQKKMRELYNILQDTQGQVDRLVGGLKKATLFEKPRTRIHPSHNSNPAWRNTVVSIYVDAQEDYPGQGGGGGNGEFDGRNNGDDESNSESAPEGDDVLEKHLSDLEKLKQLYFFSMALSVKMNREMMGKPTSEYTSTSVQKLYEDCALHSKIPVEGWPGEE